MAVMSRPTSDPRLTRWWWRTLREWLYELIDPLWAAFRGDNTDDVALTNVTAINGVTASELGVLDGLVATTGELNQLAGLTSEAAELNKADRSESDGVAQASRNIVLDENKDILGKRYDINQSLVLASARGPTYRFDGDNDLISIKDDSDLDFGTGSYALYWEMLYPITQAGSYGQVISKGWAGNKPDKTWAVLVNNVTLDGLRYRECSDAGGSHATDLVIDSGIPAGWHRFVLVRDVDNDLLTCYRDGAVVTNQSYTADQDLGNTRELTFCGSIYESDRSIGTQVSGVRLFNRALTAEEVKGLSSGAGLSWAAAGASQADLVTNGEDWTGASGSTPPNNWSDSGSGTATYIIRDNTSIAHFGDDKALELSASGGSKTLSQDVAVVGKGYRISFVYRNLNGSTSSYVALGSSSNKVELQNTGISGDGVVFKQEMDAEGTDLMFFVDNGGTLQIDHVMVVAVGCVAEFRSEGITHQQWQDVSGKEHHGAVNGAVPVNLPTNHAAGHMESGITGDTTLTGVIPAGYRIKGMVAEVTGASSGMILNVGTSSGGSDVVNGQDISSNGLFDLTVAKTIF
ncbi:MAG: hypothetical protein JSU61_07400, partial [Fidelibacterota bacterium]